MTHDPNLRLPAAELAKLAPARPPRRRPGPAPAAERGARRYARLRVLAGFARA
jgi:hypothetical protein